MRLADELADGPLLGRERRRDARRRSVLGHRAETLLANRGEQTRKRVRERLETALEVPARAVGLAELVRDRADLDRRNAGQLAGAKDTESLHRLDRDAL